MWCRWRAVRQSLSLAASHAGGATTRGARTEAASSDSLMRSVRGVLSREEEDESSGVGVRVLRDELLRQHRRRPSSSSSLPPPPLPNEIAYALREAYDAHRADPAARLRFFRLLSEGFGLRAVDGDDDNGVAGAYEAFRRQRQDGSGGGGGGGGHDAAALTRAAARLREAATPPYMRLLLPIARQTGGIAWLVQLRGDLLELLRPGEKGATEAAAAAAAAVAGAAAAPALRALAEDLRGALSGWFAPGLLRLRRLDWAVTPAQLLERAARLDRVHPMASLEELRARLDRADRRVFAFEHPSTPGDPLVVLHAALLPPATAAPGGASGGKGDADAAADAAVPSRVDQILGAPPPPLPLPPTTTTPTAPPSPAVACFYSVSSGNPGLAGVDLGHHLIEGAAAALAAEFPSLRRLATLSPMPLMRGTVERRLAQLMTAAVAGRDGGGAEEEDAPALAALRRLLASGDVPARLERARRALGLERPSPACVAAALAPAPAAAAAGDLLALFDEDAWLWRADEHGDAALFDEVLLPRLSAVYLALERRRGRALDPVANFHLTNGALLWRVCPAADRRRGSLGVLSASFGAMVNFLYEPARAHERNRRYVVEREVAVGPEVEALLRPRS